jgi:hypothetical protein
MRALKDEFGAERESIGKDKDAAKQQNMASQQQPNHQYFPRTHSTARYPIPRC